MKIDIVLLSFNQELKEVYCESRKALIPKGIMNKALERCPGIEFSFRTYGLERGLDKVVPYLVEKCEGAGVIILVDGQDLLDRLPKLLRMSCFTYVFESDVTSVVKNYLSSVLGRVVSEYTSFYSLFESRSNKSMLSLPFRNFKNLGFESVLECFTYAKFDINFIKNKLNALKKCRRPRRDGTNKKKMIYSDESYFFEYANEKHARVETGHPHNDICILTGRFRFGVELEQDQHYNMYKEGKGGATIVEGQYSNCHNELQKPKRSTHINIFPNDFIT